MLAILEGFRATTTVFYSTHILDDVQRVSDTVCILNKGTIAAQGPIGQLLAGGAGIAFAVEVQGDVDRAKAALLEQRWVEDVVVSRGPDAATLRVTVTDAETAEAQLQRVLLADDGLVIRHFTRENGGPRIRLRQTGRGGAAMSGSSGTSGLERVSAGGWRSGLSNLMGAAFGSWWRTRTWVVQSLLWTAVINGSLAAFIWGDAPDDVTVFTLFGVMTMFAAIAVAILMQEAIVGEKRSGTAAWVLSKPVSRPAFVLSKLVPNAVGIVVTMLAIPSAVLFRAADGGRHRLLASAASRSARRSPPSTCCST